MNTEEEEEKKEGSLTGELGEGVWKGGGGGKGRPIGRSCWSPPSSSFERGGSRVENWNPICDPPFPLPPPPLTARRIRYP